MAKTPATVDRFRIHAETSMEHMGFVLAELTKIGLQNIGYELITDIVTFRKNGPRKVREVTGIEFARAFVQENASFTAIQLANYFKQHDRSASSAYTAIRDMLKDDEIKRLSVGHYQRAGVKALPAPKGKRSATHKGPRQEIANKDIILMRIKGRRRFTLKELRDHFANIRRNPHSVSPIATKLAQAKIITLIEPGTYAWGNVKNKKVAKKTPKGVGKKRGAAVAQASLTEKIDG